MELFEIMIEEDSMIDFVAIPNLPYPGEILEGAVKISQIFSSYKNYPRLLNVRIEPLGFKPRLRQIFKGIDDFIDYAHFIMHSMLYNVTKRHTQRPHI